MDGTLVETELLRRPSAVVAPVSSAAQLQLAALADQPLAYEFNPHTSSGTCLYADDGARGNAATGIHWQLDVAQSTTLTLQEFSLSGGFMGRPIRAEVPVPCLPACVIFPQERGATAHLLTGTGHLATLQLQQATSQATNNKLMLIVRGAAAVALAPALAPCGTPVAMCAVGAHLCISGTTDVVASIPAAGLPQANAEGLAHIQASKWMIERLVGGLFSLGKKPSVAAIFPVSSPEGPLLGMLQQDCTLRLVDLGRQQQVAQLSLDCSDRQQQPCWAKALPAAADPSCSLLVVELQKELVRPVRAVMLADLTVAAGRSSLDNRRDLQLPAAELKMEDAAIEGARLLALLTGDGNSRVAAFDGATGRFLSDSALLGSTGPEASAASAAVVHLDLWDSALAGCGSSAEQHILSDLLVPGQLDPAALSDALGYYGSQLSAQDVETLSLQELAGHVKAAVSTSHARGSWHSGSHVWRMLLVTYGEARARRHPVQALVKQGGCVGCVRLGPLLTLLRPASVEEELALPARHLAGVPDAAATLWGACAELRTLLGGPTCDLFLARVLQGGDVLGQLVPHFAALLLAGPSQVGADSSGHKSLEAVRQQHAAWRFRRQQLVHLLEQSCASWPDLLHPFTALLQLLQDACEADTDAAVLSRAAAGGQDDPVAAAVVVTAARQVALSRCQLLRDVLLLLGLVRRTRSIGKRCLSSQQMEQVSEELLPRAHHLLQRAAVAYWLTRTPASRTQQHQQQQQLPVALPFGGLRISGPSSASEPASAPAQDKPLALKLLPAFCEVEPAQAGLPALAGRAVRHRAAAFVGFLQQGAAGGGVGADLSSRVLQLGYQLFLQKEYQQLDALVNLAGSVVQEAGPQLLAGLGFACRSRAEADHASRQALIASAAAHLFRASCGLGVGASASVLCSILQDLARDLLGVEEPFSHAALPLMLLRFFEVAMALFERERAPEGAVLFARAAVEQVAAAYGQQQSSERLQREGRLWSRLFAYACDTGRYQDAYTAIVCNPQPRRALECLKRLVNLLCDEGQVAVLCSLPFAGTMVLPPADGDGSEPLLVELAAEVAGSLTRRAHNSDLAARPQPYQVLYSFLAKRGDFSGAAAAMLAYARRLRAEVPPTDGSVTEVLHGYGAALGALSQLPASEAWLDEGSAVLAGVLLPGGAPSLPRLLGSAGHDQRQGSAGAGDLDLKAQLSQVVVPLQELQREYLLFSAAARLRSSGAAAGLNPMQHNPAQEVFQGLLVAGQLDPAISLAQACFQGQQLGQALEDVVRALAAQCVRLQRSAAAAAEPGAGLDAWQQVPAPGGGLGGRAAPYWRKLQALLEQYDCASGSGDEAGSEVQQPGGLLRLAAADEALRLDPHLQLPHWLLDMFEVEQDHFHGMSGATADAAALLRTYMRHGRLADAALLAAAQLLRASSGNPLQRQRHCNIWLPYQHIAVLLSLLSAEAQAAQQSSGSSSAAQLQHALERLQEALQQYLQVSQQDSAMLGKGAARMHAMTGPALAAPGFSGSVFA